MFFECHPELVSGSDSTIIQLLLTCGMLKQVQHESQLRLIPLSKTQGPLRETLQKLKFRNHLN